MTKEELIEIYKQIKEEKGEAPIQTEMFDAPGVTRFQIIKHFRTYGDMMLAMGDEPREIIKKRQPDEAFYNMYGNFLREHKRIPTFSDFIFYKLRPNLECFNRRFGGAGLKDLPYVFLSYATGKPEWEDVLAYLPDTAKDMAHEKKEKKEKKEKEYSFTGLKWDLYDKVPPALHDLKRLACGEGKPGDLEKKCAMALRMLGYDVQELGQGRGRNPDGIARDHRGRYAIIYDCKSRKDVYMLGTDDRQFTEYITNHRKALERAGYDMVFFLIISGRFGNMLPSRLNRIRLETGVAPGYITAENLLRVIAHKTIKPQSMEQNNLKQIFGTQGEITSDVIKNVMK